MVAEVSEARENMSHNKEVGEDDAPVFTSKCHCVVVGMGAMEKGAFPICLERVVNLGC